MLFQKLLKRSRPAPPQAPELPDGVRIYAIGDIHGRYDLLSELLETIEADARGSGAERNILVFLGDYIDRGRQSKEVIELLVGGLPGGFEAVFLKGNHEETLLQFLEDPQVGRAWRNFGGLETMASYGVQQIAATDNIERLEAMRDEFERRMPDAHVDFLKGLDLRFEAGDYIFVHAGVRPGIPLDLQSDQDLMWIREDFLHHNQRLDKMVVHGHTPSEEVEFRPHRIGVDTGAYLTEKLSCIVLEGRDVEVLQTGAAQRSMAGAGTA